MPLTWETVFNRLQTELQDDATLGSYVNVVEQAMAFDERLPPQFTNYMIRLIPSASAFVQTPKIGSVHLKEYSVGVLLLLKYGETQPTRLISGAAGTGIWEMYEDVRNLLEHNTFDGTLSAQGRSNVEDGLPFDTGNKLMAGVSFDWNGSKIE